MNFYRICLLLFSASFLLCGCSRHQKPEPIQTEPVAVETEIGGYISGSTETELSTESESITLALPLPQDTPESESASASASASIYIGSNGSFRSYPCSENGDFLTPDAVIASMASLTGWNLDLARMVTGEAENSLTVCFATSCSLFSGLPQTSSADFPVYSEQQFCAEILDSICYTLQANFSDGETDALSVYFCTVDEDGNEIPIELPQLNVTIPSGEPYQHFPSF